LEKGINPNIKDSDGIPILCRMAHYGNNEMIELYLSKGGNLNVIDETELNALHYCARYGQLKTIKYLISLGIEYTATDKYGRPPLELAKQWNNNSEIVKFLEEVEKK